jgi:hypothetical protein
LVNIELDRGKIGGIPKGDGLYESGGYILYGFYCTKVDTGFYYKIYYCCTDIFSE